MADDDGLDRERLGELRRTRLRVGGEQRVLARAVHLRLAVPMERRQPVVEVGLGEERDWVSPRSCARDSDMGVVEGTRQRGRAYAPAARTIDVLERHLVIGRAKRDRSSIT